ncbi:MAG: hypothetical protein OXR68_00425 [Alphaproteobacteria bacterium]|nr:hypothetical protein [Alphaproteobacteria bacterium]MDD9919076.1 hypothetical protein [Alphaproteobacteria bacterium]
MSTSLMVLIVLALIAVALFKNISIVYTTLKNGGVASLVVVSSWILLISTVCAIVSPYLQNMLLTDIPKLKEDPTSFTLMVFKGAILVPLVLLLKQELASRKKFKSFTYSSFIGLAPLAIVNWYFGEQLTYWQWFATAFLIFVGIVFTAYKLRTEGQIDGTGLRDVIIFISIILLGTSPAMTDNVVKSNDFSWFTSLLISNIAMFIAALFYSLTTKGHKEVKSYIVMAFTDPMCITAGIAWVLFEAVVLIVMFEYLPITVTETARFSNLCVQLPLMSFIFIRKRSREQRLKEFKDDVFWVTLAAVPAFMLAYS